MDGSRGSCNFGTQGVTERASRAEPKFVRPATQLTQLPASELLHLAEWRQCGEDVRQPRQLEWRAEYRHPRQLEDDACGGECRICFLQSDRAGKGTRQKDENKGQDGAHTHRPRTDPPTCSSSAFGGNVKLSHHPFLRIVSTSKPIAQPSIVIPTTATSSSGCEPTANGREFEKSMSRRSPCLDKRMFLCRRFVQVGIAERETKTWREQQ